MALPFPIVPLLLTEEIRTLHRELASFYLIFSLWLPTSVLREEVLPLQSGSSLLPIVRCSLDTAPI